MLMSPTHILKSYLTSRKSTDSNYTITFIYHLSLFILFLIIPNKIQAFTNIECTTNFPCQAELKPKIQFWIRVFGEFDQTQAIFHDADSPEVVYSVLSGASSCGLGRRNSPIEIERERIRRVLRSIQTKQKDPNAIYTDEELLIVNPIRNSTTFEFDKATDRIRCQNGVRNQFEKALSRYRYYKNDVIQILKESSLPEDIQYLPFVESSYNPSAYSKVNAAGLWQIMPGTARILGLRIDASTDERLDPILATKAAARYFVNSYQTLSATAQENRHNPSLLGPFVITSYNYGIGGMRKALGEHGGDFIDMLNNYKGRSFRVAVKNFYASFLAARHIVTHEADYFRNIQPYMFPVYKTMTVPKNISATKFADHFQVSIDLLRELNPMLTKRVWSGVYPIPQNFELKIPDHLQPSEVNATIASLDPEKIEIRIQNYKVQRGDTPCGVARIFKIACNELMAANGLTGRRAYIRSGQILNIPSKPSAPAIAMAEKKQTIPTPVIPAAPRPQSTPTSILIMDEIPSQPIMTGEDELPPLTSIKLPTAPLTEVVASQDSVPAPTPGPIQTSEPTPPAIVSAPTSQPSETQPIVEESSDRFAVSKTSGDSPKYFIFVENEETLGHYSDWIANVTTQDIRRLNNIAFSKALSVGQKIILPLSTDAEKESFEQKRIEYHQTLEEGFDDQYNIIAYTTYKVKRGDNEWTVSNQLQLPIWVLKKYNPNLNKRTMRIGDMLNVPILKPKSDTSSTSETIPVPTPSS